MPQTENSPRPIPGISQEHIDLVRNRAELEREIERREPLPTVGPTTRVAQSPARVANGYLPTRRALFRDFSPHTHEATLWFEMDIPDRAGIIRLGIGRELEYCYEDIVHRYAERLFSIHAIITDKRLIEIQGLTLPDEYWDRGRVNITMAGIRFFFMRNILFQPLPYPNIMVIPR